MFSGSPKRLQMLQRAKEKLRLRVERLHRKAQVPMENTYYTLKHAEKFQAVLDKQFQLIIVSSTNFNMPVYTGVYSKYFLDVMDINA